jgi:NADH-quinone oxidoreductase subunit L
MLINTGTTDVLFGLVPWVVFFPLIGLLLNLLLGKRLGEVWTGVVASLASSLAFVVSILLAVGLSRFSEGGTFPLAAWFNIGTLSLSWAFRVDTLSVTMMLVVSGVGSLIHIYATRYMHEDVRHNDDPGRYRRFFVYFNLFILAMMVLVSAANYLMLFVGWEGVGLCSYLLIGFWFEKGKDGIGNAKAAKKAFIVNRIGDFGLLIALFIMFGAFGSLDFQTVFAAAPKIEMTNSISWTVTAITLFMILAVAGKSAQIPLYVWLPDAMAGPTPVSALIHAATMVTAGVYLVARSMPLYVLAPFSQQVLMWMGALTALLAGTIAVGQYDIKKVLAYSTISQLGFMVAAVAMGATVAAMFHLITHAFFKALLFLAAGSVILGMEGKSHGAGHEELDPQDMRNMGGMRKRMPVTFWVFLIGALALSGVAPLAGFFSKDEILTALQTYSPAVFVILVAAAFLTAFYMGRQVLMVFFGKARSHAAEKAVENHTLITLPLLALALLSIVGGALNLPGVFTLDRWLEHSLPGLKPINFNWSVALLSLGVVLLALLAAWWLYGRKPRQSAAEADPLARLGSLFHALEQKWWVDELYQAMIIRPFYGLADFLANPVDQGVINAAGDGLGRATAWLSGVWSKLQNGFVRSYALVFFLGALAILTYLLLK